jgi:subtilase family serine protease
MQRKILIPTVVLIAFAFVAMGFLTANQVMTNTHSSGNQSFLIPNSETGVVTNIHALGPENVNHHISVMITLQYRNQAYLNQFLSEVQNPSSPLYHHYLTSQEFSTMFSASSTEYYHYVEYFQSRGFSVSTYADRVSIALSGSVGQFETLFGTTISNFRTANNQFYAPTSQLSLPVYFGPISSVVGLSDQYKATISPMFQGSGSSQTLYGADFQNAYQLSQLYQKYGYPTNETIATILWSGTNSAGQDVAPFVPSDISYYYAHNIPSSEPQPVAYGYPILGAPAPGPSAQNDTSQADYESTLDLEMAGSVAPGAHIVEVYGPSSTQSDLDQAFAAVLNPSYNTSVDNALSHVVAISNSWGGTDTNDSTWMQYEQEAAARGITVLASSGDDGDTSSPAPSFPATMSYNDFGTLAVGGTTTTLTGTASTNGSGTTGIQTQSVWYNTPNSGDGSQGGVSSIFAEPSWQSGSSDANGIITGASSTTGVSSGRGTPDIAADGANMEIYITYSGSSSYQELWGTSIASPLTAGVIAVMDHSLGTPEGFINPLIYKFGQEQYSGTFSGAPALYFVSNGSNGAFSAENGYSLAVGWGSINAYNFVNAQLGITTAPPPSPTDYTVTFTESGLASGTSWSVTFNGTAQSSTGTSIQFSVTNGSYSYTVGSVSGYTVSPSSGSVTVSGSAQSISIVYTASSSSGNGVFAQVQASSANTNTYTLPEAEEFTVGSSNQYVNFITLYLEGTGTIDVGIGTSVFSNNIVNITSISVNLPNGGTQNISIPSTELAGGTDYFLNVVEPSGNTNVQWGYTTSPSVDVNALQDYWYSGSTLTNDNSYPDIFQIGYSNSAAVVNVMVTPTYNYQNTVSGNPLGIGTIGALSAQAGSSQQVKIALQNVQEPLKYIANHFPTSFLS